MLKRLNMYQISAQANFKRLSFLARLLELGILYHWKDLEV